MLELNKIYNGRAEDFLEKIDTDSISLSFWSPPYFLGKDYERNESYEDWQSMLKNVITKHYRIIKPGFFLVINIADIMCFKDENMPKIMALNPNNRKCKVTKEMIEDAMTKLPHANRYELAKYFNCSEQTIDRRLHGNNIRGGKYQTNTKVKLAGGNLEKYAEEAGFFLYDVKIWVKDPTWANSRWTTNTLKSVNEYEYLYVFWKPGDYTVNRKRLKECEWKEWGLRQVWFISSVRKNDIHQAMFPQELASRVIRLYTEENDIVLDPFIGSGTTALSALKYNRKYIGFEKEYEYYKIANFQIKNYEKPLLSLLNS